MNKFKTLEQVSTILNTTNNATTILKHSYELDRIIDIKNGAEVAIHLKNVLTKDVTFKGLKEIPSQFIYEDILDMIMKRYYFLTPLEIELALQMDRYGELENKESHYQFYGTEYVGSILQRFVQWKQQKAMELNLSRQTNKIEVQIDHEKINNDYLESVLSDLKQGKILRYINANQIYKDIPESEKLNEDQRKRLFNHELKKLKSENELKKSKETDSVKFKSLSEFMERSFESTLKLRCENVAACIWLAKKHKIEINKDQF